MMKEQSNEEIINAIFESDPEIKKHFILKILELKKGKFFYMGLREDSTGKALEPIISVLDNLFAQIDKYQFKNVAFSFKEVTFFADIGMGLILGTHGRIKDNGGQFIFLEPNPNVEFVFKITGFDKIFTVYNSEAEFLKEMNS